MPALFFPLPACGERWMNSHSCHLSPIHFHTANAPPHYLSWPGLSRPSRLGRRRRASLIGIAGSSPAMTTKNCRTPFASDSMSHSQRSSLSCHSGRAQREPESITPKAIESLRSMGPRLRGDDNNKIVARMHSYSIINQPTLRRPYSLQKAPGTPSFLPLRKEGGRRANRRKL